MTREEEKEEAKRFANSNKTKGGWVDYMVDYKNFHVKACQDANAIEIKALEDEIELLRKKLEQLK